MPEITVKSIAIKKGENDKGPWVNTIITPNEGKKWTGFSEGLQYLKEGDTLNIKEYEEGQGNKYNKILKWEKVESKSLSSNVSTPEIVLEKNRESIEAQAVESILATCRIFFTAEKPFFDEDLQRVYEKSIKWCEQIIDNSLNVPNVIQKTLPEATSSKSSPETDKPELDTSELDMSKVEHYGELWTRSKNIGITKAEGLKIIGVEKQEDIIDLDEAWNAIIKEVQRR